MVGKKKVDQKYDWKYIRKWAICNSTGSSSFSMAKLLFLGG